MSIGSDPRIQAIIEAYREGEYDPYYQQNKFEVTPGQFYNPIYDIRTEQIKAGELEEGARFPKMDMEEKKEEEKKEEEPFDPCPPGYQLVGGVCQPDTMFQRGGGGGGGFNPPKVSEEGLVEGFEQVIPSGLGLESGALNSIQMMELEKKYGADLAKEMADINKKYRYRGVQYNPVTGQISAMSPKNIGEWMGDVGGAMGSMFSGYTDSLMGGGLIGGLLNLFKKDQPVANYGGSSNIDVSTFGLDPSLAPILQQALTSAQTPSGTPKGVLPPSLMREIGADTTGKDYRRAFADQELRKNIKRFGELGGFDPRIGFTKGRY
jgi:hypothetical protein